MLLNAGIWNKMEIGKMSGNQERMKSVDGRVEAIFKSTQHKPRKHDAPASLCIDVVPFHPFYPQAKTDD